MNRAAGERLLLDWLRRHSPGTTDGELQVDTPLIQRGVITSLHLADLILFIEQSGGRWGDVSRLAPGTFHSVATIAAYFFDAAGEDTGTHGH